MYGNDSIWVTVPPDGVTIGAEHGDGVFEKFGIVDLLAGEMPVVDARRLDGESPSAEIEVTGAWTSGGSLYIAGAFFPKPGCWSITISSGPRHVGITLVIGRLNQTGSAGPPETTEASEECKQSPFASTKPEDPNSASFTTTWYSNQEGTLWAGLDRAHNGRWVSGHGIKVLWVKPGRTALEAKGTRVGEEGQVVDFETLASGYFEFPYQASGVVFPFPGCWRIDGEAGNERLTFLVRVAAE